MLHKWKKIKSTMATTQYECDNCLEFSEIFEEEGIITFPPINGCNPILKNHKWELSSYAFNRGNYICNNCGETHIAYEDNPKTWLINFKGKCNESFR